MSKVREFKGYNGTLILSDRSVVIKRGTKGYLLGGGFIRGDKTIPYSSIVSVELKKAGMTAGYIQLTLKGGSEAKKGVFQSVKDENSINFHDMPFMGKTNTLFEEAKGLLEERIGTPQLIQISPLSEIRDLETLRKEGLITQAEFDTKKKIILGI